MGSGLLMWTVGNKVFPKEEVLSQQAGMHFCQEMPSSCTPPCMKGAACLHPSNATVRDRSGMISSIPLCSSGTVDLSRQVNVQRYLIGSISAGGGWGKREMHTDSKAHCWRSWTARGDLVWVPPGPSTSSRWVNLPPENTPKLHFQQQLSLAF